MRLVEARIQKFRNFDDSGAVAIEPDVTALVGKNESGKTAFLQGLYRLNPVHGEQFDDLDQYPSWLYTRARKANAVATTAPVTAVFQLEPDDIEALAARFGDGVVVAERVTVARQYGGGLTLDQDTSPDEAKAVAAVVDRTNVPAAMVNSLQKCATFLELERTLVAAEQPPEAGEAVDAGVAAGVNGVRAAVTSLLGERDFDAAVRSALMARVPRFFSFSEYHYLASASTTTWRVGPSCDVCTGPRTNWSRRSGLPWHCSGWLGPTTRPSSRRSTNVARRSSRRSRTNSRARWPSTGLRARTSTSRSMSTRRPSRRRTVSRRWLGTWTCG